MTPLEIFDAVVEHAYKQGGPAFVRFTRNDQDLACTYRNDNGRKCFIGALISDEDYRPEMDTNTLPIGGVVHNFTHLPPWMSDTVNTALMGRLQQAHDCAAFAEPDDAAFMAKIEPALRAVAHIYKLDTTSLDKNIVARRTPR